MSEEKHLFPVHSQWTDNSDGDGTLTVPWGGALDYGVPAALGGKEGRSNPEEMLTAAVVACYSITLSLLLERKRIPPPRIEVEAEGEVIRQPSKLLKFTAIRLKPRIILADAADEATIQTVTDLAHKAESYCIISNALRGNVEITVEPEVVTG